MLVINTQVHVAVQTVQPAHSRLCHERIRFCIMLLVANLLHLTHSGTVSAQWTTIPNNHYLINHVLCCMATSAQSLRP